VPSGRKSFATITEGLAPKDYCANSALTPATPEDTFMPRARLLMLAMVILLTACDGGSGPEPILIGSANPDDNPGLPASFSVAPEDTGDGWRPSTPALQAIDGSALSGILDSLRGGQYPKVDSMVVVRNGRLLAEGYFNGYGRDSLHDLRSTGKSFTSALAGIAVEQGLMTVNDPISQHIPDFERHDNVNARKRAITVRNLLDMQSGLDCDDWNPASPGNEEKMYVNHDWVKFILDLPVVFEPGAHTNYCTGAVVVLGSMISYRSGMGLDDYAATWLFAPLDIRESIWRRSPDGKATGGGGLKLRPRDLTKLGQLYLDGGVWNGQRVVSAAWVAESRRATTSLDNDGYGYLWWKRDFTRNGATLECFFTSGNGGNYVFVFPALQLVVAFTGSNYDSPAMDQPFGILSARVLPAVH
jgi:CubicO group peptidase (beta-lactamase class C family)